MIFRTLPLIGLLIAPAPAAFAFDIGFSWGNIPLCTTGRPNKVPNPAFTLKDVPEGTQFIRFKLKDHDAPGYNHGGGVVAYSGQKTIAPGAFTYKSPCPPGGVHRYEWTATAQQRKGGGKLATATASRKYPE